MKEIKSFDLQIHYRWLWKHNYQQRRKTREKGRKNIIRGKQLSQKLLGTLAYLAFRKMGKLPKQE